MTSIIVFLNFTLDHGQLNCGVVKRRDGREEVVVAGGYGGSRDNFHVGQRIVYHHPICMKSDRESDGKAYV
jgi:hypothetical protein